MIIRQKKWLFAGLLAALTAAADVKLSDCVIVSPENPAGYELDAVEEAAGQLKKVIAKPLPVVTESKIGKAAGRIYIGNTAAAKKAGLDTSRLGYQGFRLVCRGKDIYILGKTGTGTLYGVYEFLQKCGAWQVSPDTEYIIKNPGLVVRNMDITMLPAIPYRQLYHAGHFYNLVPGSLKWHQFDKRNRVDTKSSLTRNQSPADFDRRFKLSTAIYPSPIHTFYRYIPPEKYFKQHPEYFGMNQEGIRTCKPAGQLCFTNPEVKKLVVDRLLKDIAEDRKKDPQYYPLVYDFSQNDCCYYLCHCPECKKIVARYGGKDSGLLLWFLNDVAAKVGKVYPDVLIRTFAYVNTEKLPKGIKPAPNIVIFMTDLYSQCSHLLPLDHPANRKRWELIKNWASISRHLFLWDYMLGTGTVPNTPVDAIIADSRLFAKLKLSAMIMETEMRRKRPESFDDLKNFMLAQLWFNPNQDPEKLIRIFFRGYYGKAADDMLAYHEYLRDQQRKYPTVNMQEWHQRHLKHISLPMLEKSRGMLLKALAKAESEKIRLHILRELNVVDYALIAQYRILPSRSADLKAIRKEYVANCLKVIDDYELLPNRKELHKKEILDEQEADNLVFELPPELAKLPKNRLRFVGYPHFVKGGTNGSKVVDPDSTMAFSGCWHHPSPVKYSRKISVEIYDWQWKKNQHYDIINPAKDEKYHWFNLGMTEIGPRSVIAIQDWQLAFDIKNFYLQSDGALKNPNIYQVWASCKIQGPVYFPGSRKTNAIYFDRIVLVPQELAVSMKHPEIMQLINDNGFEKPVGHEWGKNSFAGKNVVLSKDPAGRSGQCMRFVCEDPKGRGAFYSKLLVPVDLEKDVLTLSVWVKGKGKFRIGFYEYRAGKYAATLFSKDEAVDADQWMQKTFTFPASRFAKKVDGVRIAFQIEGKSDLRFDDFAGTKKQEKR